MTNPNNKKCSSVANEFPQGLGPLNSFGSRRIVVSLSTCNELAPGGLVESQMDAFS